MIEPRRVKPGRQKQMQKIRPKKYVVEKLNKNDDSWNYNGGHSSFDRVFIRFLSEKPLDFLISLKKKKPKIMILGPGYGGEIVGLNRFLNYRNIFPEIDVLGLTSTVAVDARQLIKNDYSQRVSLEEIGANPKRFSELIQKLKGEYDLIVASLSVGFHTDYPVHNCFYSAMMLAPNGEAYIDVSIVPYVLKVFPRLVKAYNKLNNTDYKFNIEDFGSGSIRIKRIN